jgi:hypothetical protein
LCGRCFLLPGSRLCSPARCRLFDNDHLLYCILTGFDQFQPGAGEIDHNRFRRLATARLARFAFRFFRRGRGFFYSLDRLLRRRRLNNFGTNGFDRSLSFNSRRFLESLGYRNLGEFSSWLQNGRSSFCIFLRLARFARSTGLTRRTFSAFTTAATATAATAVAARLTLLAGWFDRRLRCLHLLFFRLLPFDTVLPWGARFARRTGFLRFVAAVGCGRTRLLFPAFTSTVAATAASALAALGVARFADFRLGLLFGRLALSDFPEP